MRAVCVAEGEVRDDRLARDDGHGTRGAGCGGRDEVEAGPEVVAVVVVQPGVRGGTLRLPRRPDGVDVQEAGVDGAHAGRAIASLIDSVPPASTTSAWPVMMAAAA